LGSALYLIYLPSLSTLLLYCYRSVEAKRESLKTQKVDYH